MEGFNRRNFAMPQRSTSLNEDIPLKPLRRNNGGPRNAKINKNVYKEHMEDLFEAAMNPKTSAEEFEKIHDDLKEKYGNYAPALKRLRNAKERRRLVNSGYTPEVEKLKQMAMNKSVSDEELEERLKALQTEHKNEKYLDDHVKHIRGLRNTLSKNRLFPKNTTPSTLYQEYAKLREQHKNNPAKLRELEQEHEFMKEKLRKSILAKENALRNGLKHFNASTVTNHDALKKQYANKIQQAAPEKRQEIKEEYERITEHHELRLLQKLRGKLKHFTANDQNPKATYDALRQKHANDPVKLREIEEEYAKMQQHKRDVLALRAKEEVRAETLAVKAEQRREAAVQKEQQREAAVVKAEQQREAAVQKEQQREAAVVKAEQQREMRLQAIQQQPTGRQSDWRRVFGIASVVPSPNVMRKLRANALRVAHPNRNPVPGKFSVQQVQAAYDQYKKHIAGQEEKKQERKQQEIRAIEAKKAQTQRRNMMIRKVEAKNASKTREIQRELANLETKEKAILTKMAELKRILIQPSVPQARKQQARLNFERLKAQYASIQREIQALKKEKQIVDAAATAEIQQLKRSSGATSSSSSGSSGSRFSFF